MQPPDPQVRPEPAYGGWGGLTAFGALDERKARILDGSNYFALAFPRSHTRPGRSVLPLIQ